MARTLLVFTSILFFIDSTAFAAKLKSKAFCPGGMETVSVFRVREELFAPNVNLQMELGNLTNSGRIAFEVKSARYGGAPTLKVVELPPLVDGGNRSTALQVNVRSGMGRVLFEKEIPGVGSYFSKFKLINDGKYAFIYGLDQTNFSWNAKIFDVETGLEVKSYEQVFFRFVDEDHLVLEDSESIHLYRFDDLLAGRPTIVLPSRSPAQGYTLRSLFRVSAREWGQVWVHVSSGGNPKYFVQNVEPSILPKTTDLPKSWAYSRAPAFSSHRGKYLNALVHIPNDGFYWMLERVEVGTGKVETVALPRNPKPSEQDYLEVSWDAGRESYLINDDEGRWSFRGDGSFIQLESFPSHLKGYFNSMELVNSNRTAAIYRIHAADPSISPDRKRMFLFNQRFERGTDAGTLMLYDLASGEP